MKNGLRGRFHYAYVVYAAVFLGRVIYAYIN